MHPSRSRGENPQNPDSDQSPTPDLDENSSSTAPFVDTSLGLGFQSTSAPPASPEPPPLRRSLRLSALSPNAQTPPPPFHEDPASAAPSDETSLDIGFQTNPAPQPAVRCPHMSTGGKVGKGDGNFCLVPLSTKRKRGRLPKGIKIGGNNGDESVARRIPALPKGKEIFKEVEVVDVEDKEDEKEEEMRRGDNVANGDGSKSVKFTDSQSGGVEIVDEDEEEVVILRVTRRCIDKGKGKVTVDEELSGVAEGAASKREKLSYKDKGKRKLIVNLDSEPVKVSKFKEHVNISDSDSDDLREMVKNAIISLSSMAFNAPRGLPHEEAQMGPPHEDAQMGPPHVEVPLRAPMSLREAQKKKAIELAPEFACFTDEKGDETEKDDESLPNEPGPFSAAMKIIEERAGADEADSTKGGNPRGIRISWTSSNKGKGLFGTKQPRLKHMSLKALAENAEEIETLVGIPCAMKSKLSFMLCQTMKMNIHHLSKLTEGSPTELRLSNCTWASDKDFEDAFGKCDKSNLEVLQLDRCGRCMPDHVLYATLACGPNSLPSLRKLSLRGAYSLSDRGLAAVVSSAPLLISLNLCQCSLLTSEGIMNAIDKRALLLRELYIDECQNVDPMSILPSLKKVKCLEVLSMAGIPSVSNKFVLELIPVCGSTIKGLSFAGCKKLTSSSIKVIGERCPSLSALDIRNLTLLKDSAIAHLANGCTAIQKLQLRKNSFSDEVIAAFVEAAGTKLVELSLNSVAKVGHQTAIAISQQCRFRLRSLDLSFCRKMSDQALGLIVDSCSSLNSLKLFGCSQVTNFFLNGYSNASVNIEGVGGDILDQIEIPDFV